MSNETKETPFQKWFANGGREKLAERRNKRYKEDPAYREKILAIARRRRAEKKAEENPVPSRYTHTVTQAAEELKVPETTIRRWRTVGYFPEPFESGGRFYFTTNQVTQLKSLATFFTAKVRRRLSTADKNTLEQITSLILANWE